MRKSKKSLKSFVKEEKNHSCYKSTKFFIPIQNDEKVFVIEYEAEKDNSIVLKPLNQLLKIL
jgi:hypothetical protein